MIEYWYEALNKPAGLCVETSDSDKLRQALYRARREAADPALDKLSIVLSPTNPTGALWIIHNGNKKD